MRPVDRLAAEFPRSVARGSLYELFFVAAVASLLLIRGALALSGFPQVGGGGLHIAHMLWGGLFMLLSLLLMLGFIGRRALAVAALLSGIGFGTFIDELGKFLTSDNDYFFRPAIAIVYVVFVLVFLATRTLETHWRLSERELLANAFDAAREAVVTRRRPAFSAPVIAYLRSQEAPEPVLVALRETLERAPRRPSALPRPLRRLQWRALRVYVSLVDSDGLDLVIRVVLIGYIAFIVLTVGLALAVNLEAPPTSPLAKGGVALIGLIASNGLSALLIAVAAWRLHSSRLAALRWFDRAVTLDLLLGQVFAFYLLQFGALLGVSLDVAVLLILKGAIRTLTPR
ncbi:MAG TPA: hypothetical protein VOB72_19415 [Candidatus Dormibacteraeota bacterium]|nr:hypothetical protein [Candidatus Dormibacteraeota bacterium]